MTYTAEATGPYAQKICQYVAQQFPQQRSPGDGDIIDLLTAELLGTKQTRFGPKPSPESIVKIRDTLRHYVAKYEPIPIVVPWGSEKPDGSSIDVAELGALRTLGGLYARISAHYAPGTTINVRVEDASAPHLFHWRQKEAEAEALVYTGDLRALVSVLSVPVNIKAEGDKVSPREFAAEADRYLPAFRSALMTGATNELDAFGWKGGLDPIMVEHYLSSYRKLYPTYDDTQHRAMLARYFAGALARTRMGLRGDNPEWGGNYLELTFAPPVPGTDERFTRRVHYRTLPLSNTSNHIAPWRAKGYLRINNDDEVKTKLMSFGDKVELEQGYITFTGNARSVTIHADYTLED